MSQAGNGPGAPARQPPWGGADHAAPAPGAGADLSRSGRCLAAGIGAFLVALGILAAPGLALAAAGPETFGPGKVACQGLDAGQFDCLLTSLRVNGTANGVATFSLDVLPAAERAIFQRWCLTAADGCTVRLRGTRQVPEGSRLSAVASVRWTRPMPPRNQAAARVSEH